MNTTKQQNVESKPQPHAGARGTSTIAKALLGLVVALAGVIIALAIVIAMQPGEFHVERSATMAAPPEAVFAQVNDFHKWDAWSPWLDLDPNAKVTFEGPEAGEGAVFRWAGNAEVGEGSMTILESRPPEYVRIELHFVKPMEDTAITEFKLAPADEGTKVTWSMDGEHNFLSKAMCLFLFDMDQMIGEKYDEGLGNIKEIVETQPGDAQPAETQPGEARPVDVEAASDDRADPAGDDSSPRASEENS